MASSVPFRVLRLSGFFVVLSCACVHSSMSCCHVHCIAFVLSFASGPTRSFPLSVSRSGAPSRVRGIPVSYFGVRPCNVTGLARDLSCVVVLVCVTRLSNLVAFGVRLILQQLFSWAESTSSLRPKTPSNSPPTQLKPLPSSRPSNCDLVAENLPSFGQP